MPKIHVEHWRIRVKKALIISLGGKCCICGYDKAKTSLHSHHLDTLSKVDTLSNMVKIPRAKYKIAKEVEKCVLLCANCHGEVHEGVVEVPVAAPRSTSENFIAIFDNLLFEQRKEKSVNVIEFNFCCVCKTVVDKGRKYCSPACLNLRPKKPKIDKISDVDPNWRHRPHMKNRKVDRPDKETLKSLVWSRPVVDVASSYGLSGSAVKKWCVSLGVSTPGRGYWNKRQSGLTHEEALKPTQITTPAKRITDAVIDQVKNVLKNGGSIRDAGKAVDWNHYSLGKHLKKRGLISKIDKHHFTLNF